MRISRKSAETWPRCSVPGCDFLASTYAGPDGTWPVCGPHVAVEEARFAAEAAVAVYAARRSSSTGRLSPDKVEEIAAALGATERPDGLREEWTPTAADYALFAEMLKQSEEEGFEDDPE